MTNELRTPNPLDDADRARLQRSQGALVLRVPGNPDSAWMQKLLDATIDQVVARRPHALVLDFSATQLLDSEVSQLICECSQRVRVLGVPVLLCELHPTLCGALIDLGVRFPGIEKYGSLDQTLDAVTHRNGAHG